MRGPSVRHTVIRLAGIVLVSAILPGLIWLAGTAIGPATELLSQTHQEARPTRSGPDVCLDAPITSSMGASGQGTLCLTGSVVRVALQVSGLAPGETYVAWLSAAAASEAYSPWLSAASSGSGDLSGTDPTGLMLRFGEAIVSSSGTLEVHGDLHDVRLAPGDRTALLLLRPGGRAGPHALAIFVVP
jgi:hypothetical protein